MNRLGSETSPYLRQHADNPVDWYPWSDAPFARARAEAKPVFLSVGYSSCHWCHVMAHESFDDESTAALMNELFVNVKVDREERPDVDAVYMQAVQALTGRGGWPMSVWLTPDGRPFYGGTYYPPDDRHGLPSFPRVCAAVADAWRTRQGDLLEQADRLTEVLSAPLVRAEVTGLPGPEVLTRAHEALRDQFDPVWGGFGGAPKFPPAMALGFLARVAVRDRGTEAASEARRMLTTTLDAMAAGGIHDHVGGGFARYAVDGYWLIPHFEKMLYDNALLVRAYLHGYLVTGEQRYRRVVEDTVGYVLRELRHPDGGFFSAEDADSEGEEGRFYVWDLAEIEEVCGDDASEVIRYFGVTAGGNFEGRSVLHVAGRTEEPSPAVERGLARLFDRRGTRVRPGVDDKVLLGWNALFLRALAEAGAALDHPDWIMRARTTARFLLAELRRDDGRLLRSWKADAAVEPGYGRARTLAFAEDYGALLEALVTLAEVDDVAWIDEAVQVADELVRLFHDSRDGGFFTTGADTPSLVVRLKDLEDGATPSANSLAANALLRLASMTGDERYAEPAASVLRVLAPWLATHPRAFAYALEALERHVGPSTEVAVVGSLDDPGTAALRREVLGRLLPATVTATAPPGAGDGRTPLLEGRGLLDGRPAAYVCRGFVCRRPVAEPEALRSELDTVVAAP